MIGKSIWVILLCVSTALLAGVENEEKLRSDLLEAQKKIELLQRQLDEMTQLNSASEAKLREYQLSLGAMLDEGEISSPERREERLLQMLAGLSKQGEDLVVEVQRLVARALRAVEKLPSESIVADALRKQTLTTAKKADHFGLMLSKVNAGERSNCHILAIDKAENLVVISAGSVNGIFPGMLYQAKGEDIVLRVISCRGFVSGASVVKGDIGKLTVGQECHLPEDSGAKGRNLL